jgi:hypothetical protein
LKKLITSIFIILTSFSFGQEKYEFDYSIETEITFYKEDSIKKKVIYLTNSNDNSYFAKLTSKDSLHYRVIFRHHDKLYSDVLVLKSELKNAEFINISCNSIKYKRNKYKSATKQYDFFNLKDTLINEKKYAAYKLNSILSYKKRKRRSSGTNLYIIENSTSFHLPLLTHPTAYEEWKLYKNIPNGLFMEKKHINFYEEEHSSEKLLGFTKVDKKIVIPDDCDKNE